MQRFFSKYKNTIITYIFIHVTQFLFAGNVNTPAVNFSVDFRSMHVWRGIATSTTPTLEPSLTFTKNNYSTGIWAAQSIDGNYSEIDIYFKYDFRNFSFTVYDYYCPTSFSGGDEFADFNEYTTKHTIELDIAYHGSPEVPFHFLIATMVYGDDKNHETFDNYYSTYFEIGYNTNIKHNNIQLFLGFNAFPGYYGEKFGVVNSGLTVINHLDISKNRTIPFQASLITNPMNQLLYLVFGFSL